MQCPLYCIWCPLLPLPSGQLTEWMSEWLIQSHSSRQSNAKFENKQWKTQCREKCERGYCLLICSFSVFLRNFSLLSLLYSHSLVGEVGACFCTFDSGIWPPGCNLMFLCLLPSMCYSCPTCCKIVSSKLRMRVPIRNDNTKSAKSHKTHEWTLIELIWTGNDNL